MANIANVKKHITVRTFSYIFHPSHLLLGSDVSLGDRAFEVRTYAHGEHEKATYVR